MTKKIEFNYDFSNFDPCFTPPGIAEAYKAWLAAWLKSAEQFAEDNEDFKPEYMVKLLVSSATASLIYSIMEVLPQDMPVPTEEVAAGFQEGLRLAQTWKPAHKADAQ